MSKDVCREINIIVTGVGGQGSVKASHIIADAAVANGLKARVGETFGAAQRGGKVHSYVRIGCDVFGPLCPKGSVDVLVGLEPNETLRLAVNYANADTFIITNTRPVPSMDVNIGANKYAPVDAIVASLKKLSKTVVAFNATDIAVELGSDRVMNVVLLGALAASGKLPFDIETLRTAIKEGVPPKTIDLNMKAFDVGFKTCKDCIRK